MIKQEKLDEAMSDYQEYAKLKTLISEQIIEHIAEDKAMTASEYGSVYDSEQHEALLLRIMRIVASSDAQLRKTIEEKLYKGGEKKFIAMLLEHGVEYSDDFRHDSVTFRVNHKTLDEYRNGELKEESDE